MANVSQPVICAACGRPLPAQQGRGRQRRYCDATCRSAARRSREQAPVNEPLTTEPRKANLDSVVGGATGVVDQVLAEAHRLGQDWTEPDPLVAVVSARRLARAVDDALRAAVDRARNAGRTWQEIGDLLGTSRQAAFQRFGRPVDPRTGERMLAQQDLLPGAAERAVDLFADFVEGRYEDVRRLFDDRMLDALDVEKMAVTWATVVSGNGAYEGMDAPFVRPIAEYTVVDLPLRFEAGDIVGRVAFGSDGKVSGLFLLRPEMA